MSKRLEEFQSFRN